MKRLEYVYVVRDRADLGPPDVRKYRFRSWVPAGCTVWDHGRIRFVQRKARGTWICGDMDAVAAVLSPILAARRESLRRVLAAIDEIERGSIRITSVPEG